MRGENNNRFLIIALSMNVLILSVIVFNHVIYFEKFIKAEIILTAEDYSALYKAMLFPIIIFNLFYLVIESTYMIFKSANAIYERRQD